MFYGSGFHEWRASHNQFTPFFSAVPTVDHGWKITQQAQQWSAIEWRRNHYVIIMIMISQLEMRRWTSGKEAFGICHHNQSHKNENKQIYCPGFMMMFDEAEKSRADFIDFVHSILLSRPLWRMVLLFLFCLLYDRELFAFFFFYFYFFVLSGGKLIKKNSNKMSLKAFNKVSWNERLIQLCQLYCDGKAKLIQYLELNFIEHAIFPLIKVPLFNVKLII